MPTNVNQINNTVGSSISGVLNSLTVTNSSNTASSESKITLTVGGGTSGDTWIEHAIGASRSYAQGIDNSDSDKLKLTTAAAATCNPSTATPAWELTPGTGFVYDQTGTTSFGIGFGTSPVTNYPLNLSKSLDGTYGINISNTSSGTSATGGLVLRNDSASSASITIPSSAFTFSSVRNKLFINTDDPDTNGIVYNVRSGQSHTFYEWLASGATPLATLNSSGLDLKNGVPVNEFSTDGTLGGNSDTAVPTEQAVKTYVDARASFNLISTATASSSASISFTGLSSTYSQYVIVVSGLAPATDAVNFWMRTSTNGGVSYDSGASDYGWANGVRAFDTTGTSNGDGDDADSQILLTDDTDATLGNAANEISSYTIWLENPSAAQYFQMNYQGVVTTPVGVRLRIVGAGSRLTAADVDAVQFTMSSGNISTGTFKLYGLKAA